jgi:lipid II:glycine glycyltransferase (peptidoglycan interpeptide bridge formation enzyme)
MKHWEYLTSITSDAWGDLLKQTNCELLYQSFCWGEVQKTKGWIPKRLVLYSDNNTVRAAIQILVKNQLGVSIVWIPGGICGDVGCLDIKFRSAVKKIVDSRFIYIRISIQHKMSDTVFFKLKTLGWVKPKRIISSEYSIIYPIMNNIEKRLQLASKNWRHNLKRGIKRSGVITRVNSPDISEIAALYTQMEKAKNLDVQFSLNQLSAIFENFKENLFYYECRDEESRLISIRAAVVIGGTGWDLLAASNNIARKQYATHAILWQMIFDLENYGVKKFDMGGIDQENNPGVYNFKKGLGGDEVQYMGEFEWSNILFLSWVVSRLL